MYESNKRLLIQNRREELYSGELLYFNATGVTGGKLRQPPKVLFLLSSLSVPFFNHHCRVSSWNPPSLPFISLYICIYLSLSLSLSLVCLLLLFCVI